MRLTLLCIALSLFLSTSQAGILSGIGAEGGVSLTKQKWNYTSDFGFGATDFMKDWDQHFNAGVFLQFFDCKYFNVITDITYNQKGGVTKDAILVTSINENYDINFDKINIWD